jgi:hypothetical protein
VREGPPLSQNEVSDLERKTVWHGRPRNRGLGVCQIAHRPIQTASRLTRCVR